MKTRLLSCVLRYDLFLRFGGGFGREKKKQDLIQEGLQLIALQEEEEEVQN